MPWKLVSSIPLRHSLVFLVETLEIDHSHSCEVGLLKISNERPLLHPRWSHWITLRGTPGDCHSENTRQHVLCSLLTLVKGEQLGCSARG